MTPRTLPIEIQERDMALLRGLFESRIMTIAHIAEIFFHGRREAAKKRIQKLKTAGLVGERPRRATDPSVLFVTKLSLKMLEHEGVLSDYPSASLLSLEKRTRVSDLTIRHELQVMDVKAAFHRAFRNNDRFRIAEFTTWPALHQFQTFRPGYAVEEIIVRPDGFVRIHEIEPDGGLSEHAFFLEVDRSTETLDTLASRATCYFEYYRTGGYAQRNGGQPSEFKKYPFRVMFVFKTEERRNNLAEKLLQNNPPILTQAWLAVQTDVIADPLALIWIYPADYHRGTEGTPFAYDRKSESWSYRRIPERELLVQRRVKKSTLFNGLPQRGSV